jgi:hypothetical protein
MIIALAVAGALVLAELPLGALGAGQATDGAVGIVYADEAATGGAVAPVGIASAVVSAVKPVAYNGKQQMPKPAVTLAGKTLALGTDYTLSYKNNKLPGTATIIVTAKGGAYTGQKTANFKIIIKAPKAPKAKVIGKNLKQIKFSWKRVSGASGYKLYYASNKSLTKAKRGKTLKGGKRTSFEIDHPYYKRNYYFKVRAYKTIKGKKYYSDYTEVRLLRTKNLKWVLVDLSKQKTYCKLGKKTKKTYVISSGRSATPTVRGTYYIYLKRKIHTMVGYENGRKIYETPNVRWICYFVGAYAFHATYWHNNFGHPMSHGCVNMRTNEAKWLYKWAPMGTKVKVQR